MKTLGIISAFAAGLLGLNIQWSQPTFSENDAMALAVVEIAVATFDETATPAPAPSPDEKCPDCGNSGCVGDGRIFVDCGTCGRKCSRASKNPVSTTVDVAVSDKEAGASIDFSPRVEVVAQVSKPDVAFMTLPELNEALDCAKQEVAAIEGEIARRTPKQVAAPVKASTCDPNCQCAITGVCTCGPDCNCTCPKAASGVAVANPTPVVTYQTRQEAVYGPMGFFRGYRTVSVPVVTSSTTVVTSRPISVSSPSRVVTTSYPSSSVKVTTPAARSSTVIYSTPRASRCVIGPDGVKRCYP